MADAKKADGWTGGRTMCARPNEAFCGPESQNQNQTNPTRAGSLAPEYSGFILFEFRRTNTGDR